MKKALKKATPLTAKGNREANGVFTLINLEISKS